MKIARILFVAFLFLFSFVTECLSDPPDDGRISIVRGGNVIFVFNAMDKYNGGITLNDWTVLKLSYNDLPSIQPSLKWSLKVWAQQSEIKYSGSDGYSIPLDSLVLMVKVDAFPVATYTKQLKDDYVSSLELLPSIEDTPAICPATYIHNVTISYKLLMSYAMASTIPSGFYYVDLSFQLSVTN